ncbi:MAG: DNA-directed RNA polymerase subunit alpha C-terminal domain-containing protein [Bacteroidota bacterium]
MEEIILPIEKGKGFERINPEVQEINIGRILSCSQRTIKSYVDRGILPKPIRVDGRIRYFSKEAVVEALGLKNLDEVLITPHEASKILKITVTRIETLVRERVFTEIKLKGQTNAKLWLIKREIKEYDVEIGDITRAFESGKSMEFISCFLNDWSKRTLEIILNKEDVDILKKVLFDKMDFVSIGKELGLTGAQSSYKFNKALARLRIRISKAAPIIAAIETKRIKNELEEEYAVKHRELEQKITLVNSMRKVNEEKISMEILNKKIFVPEESVFEKDLHFRNLMNTKLIDMDWSVRAICCFRANDLETVKDLLNKGELHLMELRNFGKITLLEVKKLLHSYGLTLPKGNQVEGKK